MRVEAEEPEGEGPGNDGSDSLTVGSEYILMRLRVWRDLDRASDKLGCGKPLCLKPEILGEATVLQSEG